MKKFLIFVSAVLSMIFVLSACSGGGYDDSALRSELTDLQNQINELQNQNSQLQNQNQSLQSQIDKLLIDGGKIYTLGETADVWFCGVRQFSITYTERLSGLLVMTIDNYTVGGGRVEELFTVSAYNSTTKIFSVRSVTGSAPLGSFGVHISLPVDTDYIYFHLGGFANVAVFKV